MTPPSSTDRGLRPPTKLRATLHHFAKLISLVRPYWGSLGGVLLLGILANALGLLLPVITKLFIDGVYGSNNPSLLLLLTGGTLALNVFMALANAVRGLYSQAVSTSLTLASHRFFLGHVLGQATTFFEDKSTGDILSRFSDLRAALSSLMSLLDTLLVRGLYVIVLPPILLWLDWRLTFLALLSFPLTALLRFITARLTQPLVRRSVELSAELNASQTETLTQIRAVKAFRLERTRLQHAIDAGLASRAASLRMSVISTVSGLLSSSVGAACAAIVTWYAWSRIGAGQLTLGTYMAFMGYLGYLRGPLMGASDLLTSLQRSGVSLERMFEILSQAPAEAALLTEDNSSASFQPSEGREQTLRAKDLSASYPGRRAALKGITANFSPGTFSVVLGPSGAGKSTLLRLLAGIQSPTSGQLTLGGIEFGRIPLAYLRSRIILLAGDEGLFRGTLLENLRLGGTEVDEKRLQRALAITSLGETLDSLNLGLETSVAEAAVTFSAGQRQRFLIARALLRQPSAIVLDEATSHLDPVSERHLFVQLRQSYRDMAVIVATHRAPPAEAADQILFLQDGSTAGVGAHTDLLANCEGYRAFLNASEVEARGLPSARQDIVALSSRR